MLALPAYADEIYKAKATIDFSCKRDNSCEIFEYTNKRSKHKKYLIPSVVIEEIISNPNYKIQVSLPEINSLVDESLYNWTLIILGIFNKPDFDIDKVDIKRISNQDGMIVKSFVSCFYLKEYIESYVGGYFKKILPMENIENFNGAIWIGSIPGNKYQENVEDYPFIYSDIFSYEITITD